MLLCRLGRSFAFSDADSAIIEKVHCQGFPRSVVEAARAGVVIVFVSEEKLY